ncbi:hypothetical protein [Helicobacter sp. MIT 05-5294]|uniref:hypothetical protein n=1 Tax=Helicobacter sp. MIT 05-5294 TaxID=1548150 RepID=UPI0010FF5967|nr:hypothetical protein [Helicobacter sp. MIT 05-5294]TLD85796.1 hypothetical protein LS69_007830 [Helicobacter sp. MIT 05-5294]
MPLVILKTNGGIDFTTPKGNISLRGYCLLNEVSDNELAELKKKDLFNSMVKDRYIEITNSKAKKEDSDNIAKDVVKEQLEKQNSKTKDIKREG